MLGYSLSYYVNIVMCVVTVLDNLVECNESHSAKFNSRHFKHNSAH